MEKQDILCHIEYTTHEQSKPFGPFVKVEVKKDAFSFDEFLRIVDFDGNIIERDGIFNIFRIVEHDNDMRAKEEYAYLYAFSDNHNHIYTDTEKLGLFIKYIQEDEYYQQFKISSIRNEDYNYIIERDCIIYCMGGFYSTCIHPKDEFCKMFDRHPLKRFR